MNAEQAAKIINQVTDGWHIVAVAVPTRALRLVRDELALKFRIEQLDITANFTWRVVSTHVGDEAWESLLPGLDDMRHKQVRLKEMIKLAQHEKRMATIKAQNPLGDAA